MFLEDHQKPPKYGPMQTSLGFYLSRGLDHMAFRRLLQTQPFCDFVIIINSCTKVHEYCIQKVFWLKNYLKLGSWINMQYLWYICYMESDQNMNCPFGDKQSFLACLLHSLCTLPSETDAFCICLEKMTKNKILIDLSKKKRHCSWLILWNLFSSICPCISINLPGVLTAKCFLTCTKQRQINYNSFDALLYQNWSQMFHRWSDRMPLLPNYHK